MQYIDIIKKNRDLERDVCEDKYKILILSNITVSQLKDILELTVREEGVYAEVIIGNYDNLVQDTNQFLDVDMVVIFFDIMRVIDNIKSRLYLMNPDEIEALKLKITYELELILNNLTYVPLVLINCFSSTVSDSFALTKSPLHRLAEDLNVKLSDLVKNGQMIVDIDKVICKMGVDSAINMRQFYSSKALYTVEFFKKYSSAIKPSILAVNGKAKKMLVLDCDNTLWGGVLGEAGFSGIFIGDETIHGRIFKEIQYLLLGIKKRGAVLSLCSKNNLKDIDELLELHPNMILRQDDFVVKKVNWNDKASNIQEISDELNLGLDSFVFVDDSPFEIGLVRERLPQVTCIQVPENLSQYPKIMEEISDLFFMLFNSDEDARKTQLYLDDVNRKEIINKFDSIDEYLSLLGLRIRINWGEDVDTSRVAQMTQKTNQFNLTTIRYTEEQIINIINNPIYLIGTFSVSDQFGDYGTTGLVIIEKNYKTESAEINSFLMSCRVIGRNIELKFMDEIINKLKNEGVKTLCAKYVETPKNEQVKKFYDKNMFNRIEINESKSTKKYDIDIDQYQYHHIGYIELENYINNEE